jgi:D-arabinose 1-dehydrogenase-like Zn-dependent alcohol dehydrogenase
MIPFMMIVCGIKVIDSLVGTNKELAELMDMAARMEIKLIIKIYDLTRLDEVL